MRNRIVLILCCTLSIIGCKKSADTTSGTTGIKFVIPTFHTDGEVKKLYDNAPNGVNIVILGDGFTKEDLIVGGTYDLRVKELMEYFFTVAPYSQYKSSFNVYVVYAESKTVGAAVGFNSANTNTAFNTYFTDANYRLINLGNSTKANQYVTKAIPVANAHLKIVLVNDPAHYGGSGGNFAVLTTQGQTKHVLVHECGHTFGGLADEYVDESIANNYSLSNVPNLPNVDNTGDQSLVKWKKYLSIPGYQAQVGAFAGGYYRAAGIFRPEENSIMRNYDYLNYNAPSREAIVKRICTILNIPFDFNDFISKDANNIKPIKAPNAVSVTSAPLVNDFVDMSEHLQQLQKEKEEWEKTMKKVQ